MKWFKHDSNASIDAKVEKLMMKYGLEGYGLYFYCLEMIARTVEKHNLTFELEHDAELIAHRLNKHPDMVQEMMGYMVSLGLFENDRGVVTCLKMASRTDEYTQKLISKNKALNNNRTKSIECPDKVPTKSDLIEENRIEENRREERSKNKFSDEDLTLSKFIFSRIKKLDQKAKEPNHEKWADTIRLLREIDKRSHKDIQDLFLWANQSEFWKSNILSPSSLRKNFTTLQVQRNTELSKHHHSDSSEDNWL